MGFKYINQDQNLFDADDGDDLNAPSKQLESRLEFFTTKLATFENPKNIEEIQEKIDTLIEIAHLQVERYEGADAWEKGMMAFDLSVENKLWESAAIACDKMFQSEGPDALKALGHGIWIGVTFPIDAEVSTALLQHLVDESPKEADTRAVAAATAYFVCSIREGMDADITFFARQLLTSVADGHSHISDQGSFDIWHKALELDNPDIFLPKLAGAIEQLVDDSWWFDKDEVRKDLD
jgi:hypothetical protein